MFITSLSSVDAALRSSLPTRTTDTTSSGEGAAFDATLAAAQLRLTQGADTPTRTLSTGSADDGAPTRVYRSDAARELAEYAEKSVAERVRDAILKDMGYTEEDLAAMDPEKRAAIEEEIARRVKAILAGDLDSTQPQADGVDALVSELTNAMALA